MLTVRSVRGIRVPLSQLRRKDPENPERLMNNVHDTYLTRDEFHVLWKNCHRVNKSVLYEITKLQTKPKQSLFALVHHTCQVFDRIVSPVTWGFEAQTPRGILEDQERSGSGTTETHSTGQQSSLRRTSPTEKQEVSGHRKHLPTRTSVVPVVSTGVTRRCVPTVAVLRLQHPI